MCRILYFVILNVLFPLCSSTETKESMCICSRIWMPVCATNGKTYGNDCEFECSKKKMGDVDLAIAHDGGCADECSDHD
ncbi:turripeptide Ici9.1-like [Coccinella septempunctata]|uniref:turripeptide Ici9.1-like n=1 Tax=Coccinella septempunctata TaxID=41139 RepID=UPI001D068E6D|nr:turripeptide Ici9.1-like [Coccinella septempunctata]